MPASFPSSSSSPLLGAGRNARSVSEPANRAFRLKAEAAMPRVDTLPQLAMAAFSSKSA